MADALDDLLAKYGGQPAAGGDALDALLAKYSTPTGGVTERAKSIAPDVSPEERSYALGAVPIAAATNFLPNMKKVAGDIWEEVKHPLELGEKVVKTTIGMGERAVSPFVDVPQGYAEQYADPLYKHLFGDIGVSFDPQNGPSFDYETLKRNVAERPVELMLDASLGLRGTGGLLSKVSTAGKVGNAVAKTGEAISTAGRAIDPVTIVPKTVGKAASIGAGMTTGRGMTPINEAFKAGYEGAGKGKDFRANLRGNVSPTAILDDLDAGVQQIKNERQAAYKAGMEGVKADPTVLDFSKIDATLMGANPPQGVYRGRSGTGKEIIIDPAAKETVGKVKALLDDFRSRDPAEFHTPEGFDQLKQALDAIRDGTKPGTAAEKLVTQTRNIVKDQITAQAPGYARVMKEYGEASDLIKEMRKTLSLDPRATIDTKLRKVLSVMRNNVNTNFGQREDLIKILEQKTGKNFRTQIAGQSLAPLEPGGLARGAGAVGMLGQAAAGMATLNPLILGSMLGQAALQSPRVMGEVAHGAGRVANALTLKPIRNALFQRGKNALIP